MVRNTSFSPPYPQKSARHSSAHTYPPLSRRKILCTKGHTSPEDSPAKIYPSCLTLSSLSRHVEPWMSSLSRQRRFHEEKPQQMAIDNLNFLALI